MHFNLLPTTTPTGLLVAVLHFCIFFQIRFINGFAIIHPTTLFNINTRHFVATTDNTAFFVETTKAKEVSFKEEKASYDTDDGLLFQRRKALVQGTWKAVQDSLSVNSTKFFYKRLFEEYPSVIPLFQHADIEEVQAAMLYQTLSTAVEALDDLDSLIPMLQDLGERHASYHTERGHYKAVGETLLWTLQAGLGEAWTDEVADAWGYVYGVISKTMADAGERAHA